MGLSVARYQLNRYTGLLNSAALRPLTRAIFRGDLLPARAGRRILPQFSPASRIAGSGRRRYDSSEDLILWPALEAVTQSIP
jgi:hypothetical protein